MKVSNARVNTGYVTDITILGPKMYNGHTKGRTNLHRDMADAVNVMLHAEAQANGEDGFARWELFAPEDVPKLTEYLQERFGGDDPISEADISITKELLEEIWSELGIRPYTIQQRVGQAVIIPALVPHYVCLSCIYGELCQTNLKL